MTIILTPAMRRDLSAAVALYRRTVGSYDYPHGDATALRTGRALARLGLVTLANAHSANRRQRWRPTPDGLAYLAATGDGPEPAA